MPLAFQPGDRIKQKVVVIEGVVSSAQIVDGDVQFAVDYVDENGEPHSRLFTEDQIEKQD